LDFVESGGVLKDKQARQLPWAPLFRGLPRGVSRINFPHFGEKLMIHSYKLMIHS